MFEKHSIKHKKIIKKKNKNTPEYVNINLIEIKTDKTTEIFKYFRSENSKKICNTAFHFLYMGAVQCLHSAP